MVDILQGRMVDIDKDTDVLAVEMDVSVVLALVRVADAARGVGVVKILKGGEIMRREEEVTQAIHEYADMVKRICMIHVKNETDTEDIFQTVFLKYAISAVSFEDKEHEKAWIVRVTMNACKDMLKGFFRNHMVPLDKVAEASQPMTEEYSEVWEAVRSLPARYRDVVYLHYYEGYSAPEISRILGKNVNTIYTWLTRSKGLLREQLEEE